MDKNPFITILQKETLIFNYALFRWKVNPKEGTYPFHKGSNYFWLFIALLHEQVIEAFAFHYYLKDVDPIRADILVVLHIYSILYMLGDYNLVRNSPIQFKGNRVQMNVGVRRSLHFQLEDVAAIEPARTQYAKSGGIIHEKHVFHVAMLPRVFTRVFGMIDELRYEIIFKDPVEARGYFGQRKVVEKALIYMEDAEPFIHDLRAKVRTTAAVDSELQTTTTVSI